MHTHTHTSPLLTVHWAPLWLRGGRRRAAAGHSEVGGQGVRRTQRRPPHVFGPELLPPRRSAAEVLIFVLQETRSSDRCERENLGFRLNFVSPTVCHLFHPAVCADGQQTVVLTLQSRSGLERTRGDETVTQRLITTSSTHDITFPHTNFFSSLAR